MRPRVPSRKVSNREKTPRYSPSCHLLLFRLTTLQSRSVIRTSRLNDAKSLNPVISTEQETRTLEITKTVVEEMIKLSLSIDSSEMPSVTYLVLREKLAAIDPTKSSFVKHFATTPPELFTINSALLDYVSYFWNRDDAGEPYTYVAPISLSILLGPGDLSSANVLNKHDFSEMAIPLPLSSLSRTVKYLNRQFGPLHQIEKPVILLSANKIMSYIVGNNFIHPG